MEIKYVLQIFIISLIMAYKSTFFIIKTNKTKENISIRYKFRTGWMMSHVGMTVQRLTLSDFMARFEYLLNITE